jgi:Beta-lactamase
MRLALVECYFLATFSSTLIGVVQAQGPAPSPLISAPSHPPEKVSAVAPQPSPAAELTKADFETFLDALVPSQLRNRNIAGAVVAVVKDGQVLFQKGYGYADFEAKKPVLPDQTLFRPGSISKLFTATAVMQLVEQGKLDLDRDVNDYLDFAIPKTYPEPVTLRQLLTHTAGFEETLKNLFVAHESDIKPLRTYLVNQNAGSHFPAGQSSVLFQLRIHARWIHRRACERRKVRALHRKSHFEAAGDEQFDVRSTPAAATRAANVERLSQRFEEAARFRICPSGASRCTHHNGC